MVHGRKIHRFLGVPYAAPPLGEQRFERPQDPSKSSNVINATVFGPPCVQVTVTKWEMLRRSELINVAVHSSACANAVDLGRAAVRGLPLLERVVAGQTRGEREPTTTSAS